MKRIFSLIVIATIIVAARQVDAQSVTLYTAGPEGLAKNIAKSFTDKTGIKVDVYQATSGDVSGATRSRESEAERRCRRARLLGRGADDAPTRLCRGLQFSRKQRNSVPVGPTAVLRPRAARHWR